MALLLRHHYVMRNNVIIGYLPGAFRVDFHVEIRPHELPDDVIFHSNAGLDRLLLPENYP